MWQEDGVEGEEYEQLLFVMNTVLKHFYFRTTAL